MEDTSKLPPQLSDVLLATINFDALYGSFVVVELPI
jgi:hypothetical protein